MGKGFYINDLAVHMERWTEEACFGWLAFFRRKTAKMPIKCTVTHQAVGAP